jgi:hypothetical protein
MLRRLTVSLAALAVAGGLAACGEEHEVTKGETEGVQVTVDHLLYQVQISRVLNATDTEDSAYIKGVPDTAEAELGDGEEWFGVFLRVKAPSENDETHRAARNIKIEDTTGAEFEPVPLDQDQTPLAYVPADLAPEQQLPRLGSIPQTTTTAGAILLFKIPRENLENRPLELHISSPGGEPAEARIDLDV